MSVGRSLILIVFFLSLTACCQKEATDLGLPICIQNEINNSSRIHPIMSVRIQLINGETHYWLQDGASDDDSGLEAIVDKNCNSACFICGECHPPACLDKYYNKDWRVIWKR